FNLFDSTAYRGGEGIILVIGPNGTMALDYRQMQPIKQTQPTPGTAVINVWTGTASARIRSDKGTATIKSVEKSELSRTYTDPQGKTTTNPLGGVGPAGLGAYLPDRSYTCDATTLSYKGVGRTFVFKR